MNMKNILRRIYQNLKILGLTNNAEKHQKIYNYAEETKHLELGLKKKKIDGTRTFLIEEIILNELMSKT